MIEPNPGSTTIAVVGGTGKEGRGLARRWAKAGYMIVIGSRSAERAMQTAMELAGELAGSPQISGASNVEAAAAASIVTLTVPYDAHAEILASIKPVMVGKLLIDATVPLMPGKVTRVHMPASGSAAQEARAILGDTVDVAAAFHTISHEHLNQDLPIDCDVLVTGTGPEARARALELVTAAGLEGWDAGPLENSVVGEGLTSILIYINKKYGSRHAGIRITGAHQA